MRMARQPIAGFLFRRLGKVGQHLVAADIERAKGHRTVADMVEDTAVELGLLIDIGKGVPHHEGDLGAVEPDAFGAGLVEMRQVDQQPGIEVERHADAVHRHRRERANRRIHLLLRQAHLDVGLDRLPGCPRPGE